MSVGDHTRPGAFVVEIGLFDTLVVPVPPPGGGGKWDMIGNHGWDGARQKELLGLIPERRLRRVSWEEHRGEWKRRPSAHLAEADVSDIQKDRSAYVRRGGTVLEEQGQPEPTEPDDAVPLQERLLRAFQWEFLMPGHDGLLTTEKHKDLIKKAVELADLPEAQAYHRAFTAWTSIEAQRNIDVKAARTKMEGLMSEYAHSVSKRNGL